MSDEKEVHVEKITVWNVVMTDRWGKRNWPHYSEGSAVERADSLFRKQLATKRGEDKL